MGGGEYQLPPCQGGNGYSLPGILIPTFFTAPRDSKIDSKQKVETSESSSGAPRKARGELVE